MDLDDETSAPGGAEALATRLARLLDVLAGTRIRAQDAAEELALAQEKHAAAEQRVKDAVVAEEAARGVANEMAGRNKRLVEELAEKNDAYLSLVDASREQGERMLDVERERGEATAARAEREAAREEARVLRAGIEQVERRLERAEEEAAAKAKAADDAHSALTAAKRAFASAEAAREAARLETEETKASCRGALLRLKEHELRGEAVVCGQKRTFQCLDTSGMGMHVLFDAAGIEITRLPADTRDSTLEPPAPLFKVPVESLLSYRLHAGRVSFVTRRGKEITLLCPRNDAVALAAALHLHLELNCVDGFEMRINASSLLAEENDAAIQQAKANLAEQKGEAATSALPESSAADTSLSEISSISFGLESLQKNLEAKLYGTTPSNADGGQVANATPSSIGLGGAVLNLPPPSPLGLATARVQAGTDIVRLRRSLLLAREQLSTTQAVNQQLHTRLAELEAGAINALRDARRMLTEFATGISADEGATDRANANTIASEIAKRIAEAGEQMAGLAVQEGMVAHTAVRELEAVWRTRVETLVESAASDDESENGGVLERMPVESLPEADPDSPAPSAEEVAAPLQKEIAELTEALAMARADAEKAGAAHAGIEAQLRASEAETKRLSAYADEVEAARARFERQCVELQEQLDRDAELSAEAILPDLEMRARHSQQESAWRAAEARWRADKRALEERIHALSASARRDENSARTAMEAVRRLEKENERLRREGLATAGAAGAAAAVRGMVTVGNPDAADAQSVRLAAVESTPLVTPASRAPAYGSPDIEARPAEGRVHPLSVPPTAPPAVGGKIADLAAPATAGSARMRGRSLASHQKVLGMISGIHERFVGATAVPETPVPTPLARGA